MNLHDIIRDSKKFSDDLTLPISDPETGEVINVPLKEVRQKFRSADADYTRKAQELAQQRAMFEQQQLEWSNRLSQPTGAPDAPGPVPLGSAPPDELEALFDPYLKKVTSRYDPVVEEIKSLRDEFKRRNDEVLQVATTYAGMEIARRYNALSEKPTTDDGRVLSAKEYAQYALSRGYRDEYGFPDFDRATNDYLGPQRREKELKAVKEQARKEAYEEFTSRQFMSPPGMKREIGLGSPDNAGKKPGQKNPGAYEAGGYDSGDSVPGVRRTARAPQHTTKSRGVFNEALSAALEDASIREGLFALNQR